MPIVVSDASPLIYLSWIGHLDLLRRLYENVMIPPSVWNEVAGLGDELPGATEAKRAVRDGWLTIEIPAANPEILRLAADRIDRGEIDAHGAGGVEDAGYADDRRRAVRGTVER